MLPGTYQHVRARRDVDGRGFARIGLRDPYLDGEAVCCPPKIDRDGVRESEEEGGGAIFVMVYFGSWSEGGEGGEGTCSV